MNLLVYYPGAQTEVMGRTEQSIVGYCMTKGWIPVPRNGQPDLSVLQWVRRLEDAIEQLRQGDTLLIPDLASISSRPSVQEKAIRAFLAKGIRLHTLQLGAIEPHLLAMSETWEACKAMETELDAIKERLENREREAKEEREDFEKEYAIQMASRFGVKGLLATPAPEAPPPEPVQPVGLWIRQQRELRGWTQEQLAEEAKTSKPSVSRIENSGKGEALPRILLVLSNTPPEALGATHA